MLDQKKVFLGKDYEMTILNSCNLNRDQICHFICNTNELTDFYIDGIFTLNELSKQVRVPLRKTLHKK